jgi:hypothetical protein
VPCRCRKGSGLRATTTTTTIAVTVDGGVEYALLASSGKTLGKFRTELEARAARVRAGGGTIRRLRS